MHPSKYFVRFDTFGKEINFNKKIVLRRSVIFVIDRWGKLVYRFSDRSISSSYILMEKKRIILPTKELFKRFETISSTRSSWIFQIKSDYILPTSLLSAGQVSVIRSPQISLYETSETESISSRRLYNIPNHILKNFVHDFPSCMTDIFNRSISSDVVACDMEGVRIFPLFQNMLFLLYTAKRFMSISFNPLPFHGIRRTCS